MANLFWVGGTGTVGAANRFATTSGGTGSVTTPTAADNVFFDGNSGTGTVTLITMSCRSFNCTGYAGTISHPAAVTVTVGDATAGSGNIALKLVAGMTYTIGNASTSAWVFASTSATQQTIDPASPSKTFGRITINGAGSDYLLNDDFTTTDQFILTTGSLNDGGHVVTMLLFVSTGTATRSLTKTGDWKFTAIGANNIWNVAASLGGGPFLGDFEIVNAATATRTFAGAGLTYGTLRYTVANSAGALAITGSNTFTNLDIGPGRTVSAAAGSIQTVIGGMSNGTHWNYVVLPGTGYATVADSVPIGLTGDMDLRIRTRPADWTATANLLNKQTSAVAGTTAYAFAILSGGNLRLSIGNGVVGTNATASVATGFSPGDVGWVRVTRRVSDGRVQFFKSTVANPTGPADWIQIGTDQTNASSGQTIAQFLAIGAGAGGASPSTMTLYRAQIRDNVLDDGTGIVLDADFTTKPFGANTFTESSTNAATVTLVGLSQVGDGRIAYNSSTAGNQAFLDRNPSAPLDVDYATFQDIGFVTPFKLYTGANAVDAGNNQNINFATAIPDLPYIRQHAFGVASTTVTATYPGAVAAGTLLIAQFAANINTIALTGPSGWTSGHAQTASVSTQPKVAWWWKIADGTETTVTVTVTTGTGATNLDIFEVAGWHGTPTLDASDFNTSAASAVTSLSSGAGVTSAPSAYAMALWSTHATHSTPVDPTDWQRDLSRGRTNLRLVSYGRPLATATALNPTYAWTSSTTARSELSVFKDVTAAVATGSFFPFF